jgi:hypothetical protein
MVDISAVAGLMTSLRSVVEITKAMKDVNDANVIQTKVFELTREIMAAQSCALEAQTAQSPRPVIGCAASMISTIDSYCY